MNSINDMVVVMSYIVSMAILGLLLNKMIRHSFRYFKYLIKR